MPNQVARSGIAFCPEERGIFGSLSVTENLVLPPVVAPGGLDIDEIYTLFPNLKERARTAHGTRLSGGEQQMLAIARILRTGAKLLLLDEPTEGLAPVIVQQIGRTVREIKQRGFTVLLVEQNFRFAQTVADRHYVMEHGQVIDMIPNHLLEASMDKLHEYLGAYEPTPRHLSSWRAGEAIASTCAARKTGRGLPRRFARCAMTSQFRKESKP